MEELFLGVAVLENERKPVEWERWLVVKTVCLLR